MNTIRRILAAAATLAGALLALAAAAPAYASLPHPHGGPAGTQTTVHVITTGGMPGWQIVLIAAAAALIAAALAVLLDHAWTARRTHATTA
jgi:hypothetical protein